MKLFLYCFFSFSLAWIIHLLIWRNAQPKKHTRALLIIFMSVLISVFIASITSFLPPLTWIEGLHVMIFYIPTMLAYICFYSAIEEDSPSVGLITMTAQKKKCVLEDYDSVINDQLLVGSRLSAMVRDGLLKEENEQYRLTSKGFFWGTLFTSTYQFLQLKDGG